MDRLVCVSDFELAASEILDKNKWEFLKSGADDECTSNSNREAFNRWLIRPRMLRDVSQRTTNTFVLGKPVRVPFGVCPMGFQRTMHPEGEVASAKAAAAIGGIFILSFYATTSADEIAAAAPNGRNWLQIFVHKDKQMTKQLIKQAENAGFEAIVLTVDAQYVGKRRVTRRNPFSFPTHLRLKNALPGNSERDMNFDNLHSVMDLGLTWDVIKWLKRVTRLPIVVKGILTEADAKLCVSSGVDALIVSNHGGRQLDTTPPTIDILWDIVKAVDGKIEVYMDSGVTKGADIFKALALGAKMVFAGRAIMYGVAVNGEQGASRVLEILRDELDLTMALSGVTSVQNITPDYVQFNGNSLSKL